MNSKIKQISFFLPSIIALVFLVMITVNGIRTYTDGQAEIEKMNKALVSSLSGNLKGLLSVEKKNLRMATELLLNDQDVVQQFVTRDRNKLASYLTPIYENKLKKDFGIKQFQFHTPPATSFLRLHKVSKFGDDLSSFRKTVVQSNKTKKYICGLEVGKGGLGMRLVAPINFDSKHFGTMEFGTSFKSILDRIAKRQNVTFAIGVYQEVFKSAGRANNSTTDFVMDDLIYYDYSNSEIKSYLADLNVNDEMQSVTYNNKDYEVVSIPITDYSNKKIGYVTFFRDQTEVLSNLSSEVLSGILIPLVLATILLAVILFVINRKIIHPLNNLVEFTDELTKGNYQAKQPEAYFTDLQKLSNSMGKLRDEVDTQYQMLNNLPSPVMKIDREFNIEYMNLIGAKVVGSDPDSLVGKKCYDYFKTGHCHTDKCAVARAIKENEIVTEETVANPNNTKMEIMYTGAPIKNNNGEIVSGLEFVADISEMKDRENYLARSTENILVEMEKFSQGDLSAHVVAEKDGDDIAKLFEGFNRTVRNMQKMILQVREAVEATTIASIEISSSVEEMAAGAQEQSAQTSEVAAAMEEMSRTVVDSASNATIASDASNKSSAKAHEGSEKLNSSKKGMERIVKAADNVGENIVSLANKTEQIGEMARVIDEIADQTNLLALNAAIEAARAGEHGKGFAVVADEVRKLAERTTKATKEIAETIDAIKVESHEANTSMSEAGIAVKSGLELNEEVEDVLSGILSSVEDVTQQINQVAAASEEQSATASQVSKNIEAINNVANESAIGIQQIASASEDLNKLTENLSHLVDKFKYCQDDVLGNDHKQYEVQNEMEAV